MKQATITFTVTATVKLAEGRESTRDYVAEDLRIYLEDDSKPDFIFPDRNEYAITSWTVSTQ